MIFIIIEKASTFSGSGLNFKNWDICYGKVQYYSILGFEK